MVITVNGKEMNIEKEISLPEFLVSLKLDPKAVVIEHNSKILRNNEWVNIFLKENDTLELIRFVGGG